MGVQPCGPGQEPVCSVCSHSAPSRQQGHASHPWRRSAARHGPQLTMPASSQLHTRMVSSWEPVASLLPSSFHPTQKTLTWCRGVFEGSTAGAHPCKHGEPALLVHAPPHLPPVCSQLLALPFRNGGIGIIHRHRTAVFDLPDVSGKATASTPAGSHCQQQRVVRSVVSSFQCFICILSC